MKKDFLTIVLIILLVFLLVIPTSIGNDAKYNNSLCIVNTTNGYCEFVGLFQDNSEVFTFAIPYNNSPPTAPIIEGPSRVKVGVEYKWSFYSTDPDEDNITYYVDWGDECGGAEWHGPYPSGEKVEIVHTYTAKNTLIINSLTTDEKHAESDWSYFEVIIPRSKLSLSFLFINFLDRFPIIEEVYLRLIRD